MNTVTRCASSVRFLLAFFAAILLPLSVEAQQQPKLSVTPTSVAVETTAGTNAPSRTVLVRNAGKGALRWSISPSDVDGTWLQVSPMSGGNNNTLTLTFVTQTMVQGTYQGSFTIRSNGVSPNFQRVDVSLKINPSSTSPLTVTCPASMSVASPDGNPVVVNYIENVTTSGGKPPVTVTGAPIASGNSFPVGTTQVTVTARDSDTPVQEKSCGFSVTVTYSPSPGPSPTGVGPQSTITCPTGAVEISTSSSIQFIQGQHPAPATFCLKADGDKIHRLNHYITPRTGDTFVGEYGAVLDGTLMAKTTDDTEAAFRAYDNQNIDNVTIRNLVIRNFRRGIHASPPADHWTIEFNEIASNYSGLVFPSDSSVKNNYVHHNSNGGYQGAYAHNSTIEGNEIAYNGTEQKVMESANVTFRNNFVHHNAGAGIWYDSNNTGVLVVGNTVEDNGYSGIWHEVGGTALIHNNTIRRSGDAGVFISTSKDTQVYNNLIENNFRAITYFVNCPSLGGGTMGGGGYDLTRVSSYGNTIVVGTQSGAWASAFGYAGCTGTQLSPYQSGSKDLTFYRNAYDVPSPTTGQYWYWGGLLTWTEWQQQRGQDLSSTGSTVQ